MDRSTGEHTILIVDDVPANLGVLTSHLERHGYTAVVAQGKVMEFSYHSDVTGTERKANVYLPAGYTAERRYPVLYLLHGIGGNQDEWRGYVRATDVLDNLIAAGAAVPMIVVMPNGRALADDRAPPPERHSPSR